MGGFHLGRPIPFLVNAPNLSRNLLRAAIPCFVPRISGIYMKFETLQRIWQWFSYWGHMSMMCLCVCISSPQGQDMLSEGTADQ